MEHLIELYRKQHTEQKTSTRWRILVAAIVQGIQEGVFRPGERLPTHRELAQALGITVGTVSKAYAETARRNLTSGVVGKGTFVNAPERGRVEMFDVVASRPSESLGIYSRRAASPAAFTDLSFIAPFEYLNPDLQIAVRRLAEQNGLNGLGGYQPARGLERHREAGALWAARFGLPVSPENVLICAGAQHALVTVLASLFDPGDRIAVEQLSYPLIKLLARRLRLNLIPIKMDKFGMLPSSLEAACRSGDVRGVYLMPTCHNPTLAMLPEYRRIELVELCRKKDLIIIEDDVYALTSDQRLPPLSRLAPERGCFIASTSEALCAGLRVAYLCAPEAFIDRLERTISYTVSMTPPLMAELAAMWIGDGTADDVLAAKRREAARTNALVRRLLDGFPVETRTTGFFCWLRISDFPGGVEGFSAAARQKGILVADSSHFALTPSTAEQGVRIALGIRDHAALENALQSLAELLQQGAC